MSERTVSVVLKAKVDGFTSGFKVAQKSVDDLTRSSSKLSKADAFGKVADKAAIAGLGVATAVGVAVKRFADFDASMSAVKANTGATGASLDALRQAAITMGADSVFSAKEAADGINELGKAGLSTSDIMGGGLKGSLDLAAAGQIGVADAAETTASALTQFNLGGDQAVHVADLLTNGANKAQGGVGDLGAALNQTGLVAAATGLTIDETTAGLTAFASAGLTGSDAGTSFKTMLQRLSAPTAEARAKMDELGISAYDANGNFVGLEAIAGQLKTGMEGLDPATRNAAMATIFGADAVRGANVLYTEGAAGIASWTDKVTEQGAAAKQAATLTDNLKGDVERLGGAFDSVFIQTGSGANGGLRTLTQGITGLVTAIGQIPGPLLLAGGGVTAFGLLAPKGILAYREYASTLDDLGLSLDKVSAKSPRAGKALGGLKQAGAVIALAAVTSTLQDMIAASSVAEVEVDDLARSLEGLGDSAKLSGGIADLFRDEGGWLQQREDVVTLTEAVERFGTIADDAVGGGLLNNLERLSGNGAVPKFEKQVAQLDGALASLVESGNADQAAASLDELLKGVAPENVDKVRASFTQYNDALKANKDAAAGAASEGVVLSNVDQAAAASAEEAAKAADEYAEALDGVKDAITRMGGGVRAEQQAFADSAEALKAAQEAAKGSTAEQESALRTLSASYLEVSAAQVDTGRGAGEVGATMAENRARFIETATAMGVNATYAGELATAYGLVPKDVQTLVSQVGAETASEQVTNLKTVIRGLDGKTVTVQEAGKAKPSKDNVLKLDGAIFGLKGKTVSVQELGSTASGDRVVKFQGQIYTLKGKTVTVSETGATAAAGRVGTLRSYIDGLTGKTVTIKTAFVTQGRRPGGGFDTSGGAFASGGAVFGAGTSTSDSIDAKLSHNEHVWTAAEVQALGGHGAMYALRAAVKAGNVPKFADGGAVMSTSRAAQYAARPAPMSVRPIVNVTAPQGAAPAFDAATLRSALTGLQVVMDGKAVGVLTAPHVTKEQHRTSTAGQSRRIT